MSGAWVTYSGAAAFLDGCTANCYRH